MRALHKGLGLAIIFLILNPILADAATVRASKPNRWGKFATAEVSWRYVSNFQGLVDELERAGYRIDFMGGVRAGRCAPPERKHPCGMALDINQTAWGVVTKRFPMNAGKLARRHGLFSGGNWAGNDYGHFEVPSDYQNDPRYKRDQR